MAKIVSAYADNKGVLHVSPEDASIADMISVLSAHDDNVPTIRKFAVAIFKERSAIEKILKDLDDMQVPHNARYSST